MGTKKDARVDEETPEPRKGEPISGTRKNDAKAKLQLATAAFKARAAGLEGPELEREIERFLDQLIEKQMQMVPEQKRPELRALLREQLAEDPTLKALVDDLRAAGNRR